MINRENLIKIGRAGGNTSNRETPDQIGRVGMSVLLKKVLEDSFLELTFIFQLKNPCQKGNL